MQELHNTVLTNWFFFSRRLKDHALNLEQIHDPPALNPKGRPRTAHITGALEGPPQGGGTRSGIATFGLRAAPKRSRRQMEADKASCDDIDEDEEYTPKRQKIRKCSACKRPGHRWDRCPFIPRV